jgi:hypothetical protein
MSYDDDQAMYHQAELERQQMLIKALSRAMHGLATPDDWNIIRFECGLSTGQFRDVRFNTNLGEEDEFSSEINRK